MWSIHTPITYKSEQKLREEEEDNISVSHLLLEELHNNEEKKVDDVCQCCGELHVYIHTDDDVLSMASSSRSNRWSIRINLGANN